MGERTARKASKEGPQLLPPPGSWSSQAELHRAEKALSSQGKVAAGSWSHRTVSPSCQHLQLHFNLQATRHQERRSSIVLPTLAGPPSHAADQGGDHLPQGNSFPHRQPLLKGVFPTELYCSGITPSLLPHRELTKVSSHCPSQQIHSGFQKEWNKMPRNGGN